MEFPQLRAEVLTAVATGVRVPDGELPMSRLFNSVVQDVRGDVAKWDEKQPIRTLDTAFEGREGRATTTSPGTVQPKAAGMYTSFKKRIIKPEVLDQLRAVGGSDADVASADASLGLMIGDMMRRHYWEKMEYLVTSALLDNQSVSVGGATVTPDFNLPATHDITVGTSWATSTTDIDSDVETLKRLIAEDSGRAAQNVICGRNVFGYLRKNDVVKEWFTGREGAPASYASFFGDAIRGLMGLNWYTYMGGYVAAGPTWTPYIPDDTIIVMPAIDSEWFQIHRGQVQRPSTVYGGVQDFVKTYGVAAWSRLKDDPPEAWYYQRWAGYAIPVFPSAYAVADVTP
jgi:hypothetical protein